MRLTLAVALCGCATACLDFDRAIVTCMDNGGCATPRTIVVTSDAGLVTDLPLLVPLSAAEASGVTDPATDLRFVDDATGQALPFEVSGWDGGGEVWVRLPRLDGRATLTLFHGPHARGAADAGAVWAGWELVHHFEPGLLSSADGRYAATRVGGQMTRAGIVGEAPVFPITGDRRITFAGGEALFDGWAAFTLAFWLYPDYASPAAITNEAGFLDKGGGINLGRLLNPGSGPRFQVDMHFTGGNDSYLGGPYGLRQWNFVVYTFDGTDLRLYVDGREEGADRLTGGVQTMLRGNNMFFMGDRNGPMNGAIDELWIDRTRARDARWIAAVHRSMRQRDMVTVVAE